MADLAEQQLKLLRQKFEAQEREFQSYRDQCKNLQNFLEEESRNKEQEVRRLKQQSINKQKNFKLIKTENAQLQTEISNLKSELNKTIKLLQHSSESKNKSLEVDLAKKTKEIKELHEQLSLRNKQLQTEQNQAFILKEQLFSKEQIIKHFQEDIATLNETISAKNKEVDDFHTKYNELKQKYSGYKQKVQELTHRKDKKKDESTGRQIQLQKELLKSQQKAKRYQDKILKMQKIIKQLRLKLTQSRDTPPPQKLKLQQNLPQFKLYIGCLIMTKQHYISPFLDINEQTKTLKLFKSSRNGCFQKSLGSTKHKFQALSYEQTFFIDDVVSRVLKFEQDCPHFVLIYGTKKSAKKIILSGIIAKLLEYFQQKLQSRTDGDYSATYIRKTKDQQSSQRQQAFTLDDIISLLKKMVNISSNQLKKQMGSQLKRTQRTTSLKKADNPRITYFNLKIGDLSFEIATSSFTNIAMKQKQDAATFYNNVLYSKLPNILQTSYGQKYIILTLNPIVDLYDDCKNILSVTLYKSVFLTPGKNEEKETDSPNKEMLNAYAKKKLEQYQKEIEQHSLKNKKLDQECFFYKLKFCQLQQRLKNLISTHHSQNSYLKKSPILLSYQKMLKFIHTIQSKNAPSNQQSIGNAIQLDSIYFQSDDDDGSLHEQAF